MMSLRIAVALAATFGAGLLVPTEAQARPEVVGLHGEYSPGTIVVRTNERRLYLILDQGHAVRYPVGVGRFGKQWAGTTQIDGKYRNPAWSPPSEVKHDKPNMRAVVPGGSPRNPMGVAAMTLAGGEYAIHGTNMPGSVGGFVSYGCIRMLNADISDLFNRVSVGTRVVVTPWSRSPARPPPCYLRSTRSRHCATAAKFQSDSYIWHIRMAVMLSLSVACRTLAELPLLRVT